MGELRTAISFLSASFTFLRIGDSVFAIRS